jgi:hypothetical protein
MDPNPTRANRSKGFHTHGALPLLVNLVELKPGKQSHLVNSSDQFDTFSGKLALVNTNKDDNLGMRGFCYFFSFVLLLSLILSPPVI